MNDKHILLVEDDETLQALIEKLLINNDYVVSKAVNIEEAKKLVKLFLFALSGCNLRFAFFHFFKLPGPPL